MEELLKQVALEKPLFSALQAKHTALQQSKTQLQVKNFWTVLGEDSSAGDWGNEAKLEVDYSAGPSWSETESKSDHRARFLKQLESCLKKLQKDWHPIVHKRAVKACRRDPGEVRLARLQRKKGLEKAEEEKQEKLWDKALGALLQRKQAQAEAAKLERLCEHSLERLLGGGASDEGTGAKRKTQLSLSFTGERKPVELHLGSEGNQRGKKKRLNFSNKVAEMMQEGSAEDGCKDTCDAVVPLEHDGAAAMSLITVSQDTVEFFREMGIKGGQRGGRPLVPAVLKRAGTNMQPGQRRRRVEVEAWVGLKMIKFMEANRKHYSDEAAFWKAMVANYEVSKAALLRIVKKKAIYEQFMKTHKRGSAGALRAKGSRVGLQETKMKSCARGCRAQGAGRRNEVLPVIQKLKIRVIRERELGHGLNLSDLWHEFQYAAADVLETLTNTSEDKALRQAIEGRLQALRNNVKYLETYKKRLVAVCGLKLRRPQRVTKMSPAEEQCSTELGWQLYDRALWLAGCAPVEELSKHVLQPERYAEKENIILGFSDQVPYWIGLETDRQLYLEGEFRQQSQPGVVFSSDVQHSQKLTDQTQTRSEVEGGPGKARVTVELRQVILDYFVDGKEPEGLNADTLIIFPGKRARLENISEEGTFIVDECFEVAGEPPTIRKAGQSAGNLMRTWRQLREQEPHLFEGVKIWQQPAAVMDSVLTAWSQADLSLQYPAAVWQRDCLGCALTDRALEGMYTSSHIAAWIPGGMTPVMQIVDTDLAAPFKAACRRSKDELRTMLKRKALQEEVRAPFKMGYLEILAVIQAGLKHLAAMNAEHKTILKAARRNGLLAYRPLQGNMVPVDEDEGWAADMPQGSHRMKDAWLENRYAWMENGIPVMPQLANLDMQAAIWREAEIEYAREKLEKDHDALVLNLQEGYLESGRDCALLQKPARERLLTLQLEAMTSQREFGEKKKRGKKENRLRSRIVALAEKGSSTKPSSWYDCQTAAGDFSAFCSTHQ